MQATPSQNKSEKMYQTLGRAGSSSSTRGLMLPLFTTSKAIFTLTKGCWEAHLTIVATPPETSPDSILRGLEG